MPFLERYLAPIFDAERGDVVVFIYPEDRSKDFIKRVIGVAGDTVEVRAKKVFINGKQVEDPHAHFAGYDPQAGAVGSGDDYGPKVVPAESHLCHGRQSRPQLRQPFLGFCQSRRGARQSLLDLLVLGRQRPLGALGAPRQHHLLEEMIANVDQTADGQSSVTKKTKIFLTIWSSLLVVLVLFNILISLGNQSIQAEVAERQQEIAQTIQLETLNRQLITVLANLASRPMTNN